MKVAVREGGDGAAGTDLVERGLQMRKADVAWVASVRDVDKGMAEMVWGCRQRWCLQAEEAAVVVC